MENGTSNVFVLPKKCNLLTGPKSPMVTIYTTQLIPQNTTFCPHRAFMCFIRIWEQTAIIAMYIIFWLSSFLCFGLVTSMVLDPANHITRWTFSWRVDSFPAKSPILTRCRQRTRSVTCWKKRKEEKRKEKKRKEEKRKGKERKEEKRREEKRREEKRREEKRREEKRREEKEERRENRKEKEKRKKGTKEKRKKEKRKKRKGGKGKKGKGKKGKKREKRRKE